MFSKAGFYKLGKPINDHMLIKNKPQLFLLLIAVFFVPISCVQGQLGKDNSGEYRNGMVVCAYPDAAQVGLNILKKGGS